ncbi:MmcQ/YjbR family DNA-binding protein [Streptomyces afghaniensis]|uniref:MmcQ/YjbR family DNA-binding protein n=1 Tax=Streptomyces afghaniensis TaxID=66865 RepID=UPI003795EAA8
MPPRPRGAPSQLEHPFGPDWEVYKVRGKVFMLMTEVPGRPVVILKADPGEAHALREQYSHITPGYRLQDTARQAALALPDVRHARAHVRGYASITPGRYLDKRHWISLGPGPGITERLVTDAVEDSYDLVAERLPRRNRPGAR